MNIRYTKEMIQEAVRDSLSWAEVCRKLGAKPATGSQTNLKSRAVSFGVDFSHFTGQAWSKGKTIGPKRPLNDYLSNLYPIKSHSLKLRLISEGIFEDECSNCGVSEWMDSKIPLELDHLDRNHDNNALENLQILCPNCHAIKTRRQRSKK